MIEGQSGRASDGYISGAEIFIDANGDGLAQPEESTGVFTDDQGMFTLGAIDVEGSLIAIGGTNIDTGLANTLQLSAPDGSTMINPLTTLVQAYSSAQQVSVSAAESAIQNALGITSDIDLNNYDPLAQAEGDATALAVHKAATQVATLGTLAEQAGVDFSAVVTALAETVADGTLLDMDSQENLTGILGATLSPEQIEDATRINSEIEQAATLGDISTIQEENFRENTSPSAENDEATTNEDTPITINVLSNDSDVDDDTLALISFSPAQNGTVVINDDNTITYSPKSNYFGVDSFSYSLSDGRGGEDTATVMVNVKAVNDAPVLAHAIAEQTATEGTGFNYTVPVSTFSDVDGDPLTYATRLTAGGVLPAWLSFDTSARTFSGTPDSGDVGTLEIRVTATDSQGASAHDDFTVVVTQETRLIADGDVAPLGNPDGLVKIGDALLCLRYAIGLETPSAEEFLHADVAPLYENGQPNPDGIINIGDALVILRKALGLESFEGFSAPTQVAMVNESFLSSSSDVSDVELVGVNSSSDLLTDLWGA
jgi:hypothetical protein